MNTEEPAEPPERREGGAAAAIGQAIAFLLAIPFMLLLLALGLSVPAGVVYAIVRAFPDEIPQQNDSGWLDLVLSNQFVVFAARIILILLVPVLVFAGIYISISIFVRMYRKDGSTRPGRSRHRSRSALSAISRTSKRRTSRCSTRRGNRMRT